MRIGAVVGIAVLSIGPAVASEVKLQGPPAPMARMSSGSGRVLCGIGAGALAGGAAGAALFLASGEADGAVAAAGVAAVWTLPASVTGAVVGRRGPVWAGALAGAGVEALLVAALVASIDEPGSDTSGLVALGAGLGAVSGGVAAAVAHEPALRVGGASLTAAVVPARGRGVAGSLRVTF